MHHTCIYGSRFSCLAFDFVLILLGSNWKGGEGTFRKPNPHYDGALCRNM